MHPRTTRPDTLGCVWSPAAGEILVCVCVCVCVCVLLSGNVVDEFALVPS